MTHHRLFSFITPTNSAAVPHPDVTTVAIAYLSPSILHSTRLQPPPPPRPSPPSPLSTTDHSPLHHIQESPSFDTMSDSNNSPPRSPPLPERRRSSFAGLADIFGRQPNGQPANNQNYQGPITAAAAQANRRRLSVTTLGLSGSSPNTASSFTSERSRGASISSATSASVNESPFDDDDVTSPSPNNLPPNSPFARRLSFGAQALRESQQGNRSANANGRARPDPSNKSSPPSANSTSTSATKGRGLSCSLPSTPEIPEPQFPCAVPHPNIFLRLDPCPQVACSKTSCDPLDSSALLASF